MSNLKVKKIGIYITKILYNVGGTESYSAKLAETLQKFFDGAQIFFVTECFSRDNKMSDADFVKMLNSNYGTSIFSQRIFLKLVRCKKSNFIFQRIMYKKIQNASKNFDLFFYCSVGNFAFKAKKNIAVIHFPAKKIAEQKRLSKKFDIPFLTRRKDKKYLSTYDLFLPNSKFTETHLKNFWPEIPQQKIRASLLKRRAA